MTNVQRKIEAFKREAGAKDKYNTEQQKIYTAFTKENGKDITITLTDCEGVKLKVLLKSADEVQKILLKHYKGKKGTVTAKEILNMFDVVRTGKKQFNIGNYVYRKRYVRNGSVYFTVIKLFANGKDAVLKSFHSNIGYK